MDQAHQHTTFDTAKWVLISLLLLGGIVGFYAYAAVPAFYRTIGLLAIVAVSTSIAMTTVKGREAWQFLQGSRTEVRKMVWPSRTETIQTSLAVFAIVLVMAIFLWLLDMLLGWGIKSLIGS